MEKIKLVKEGNYWTLYIGELQCGCGFFEDMMDVVKELETYEQATEYAKDCQKFR